MSEEIAKIKLLLAGAPWQAEKVAREIEELLSTLEAKLTMSERDFPLREKKVVSEYIDDDGIYVKSEAIKRESLAFWLRFIEEWFHPCHECTRKLNNLILNAEHLIIGNKDYVQPIELQRRYEIDDDSWKEIERRQPTKEEEKRLKKL